jgi:hypothetical protein
MSLRDQVVASFSDCTERLMTLSETHVSWGACLQTLSQQGCVKYKAVWRETRERFTRHAHATYQDLSIINAAFLIHHARSGNAAKLLCPSTHRKNMLAASEAAESAMSGISRRYI